MNQKKLNGYILNKLANEGLINRPELAKAMDKIA